MAPINTDQAVPVEITAHQIPVGTIPVLTILGDSVDQPPTSCPGGLIRDARQINLHLTEYLQYVVF